MYINGKPSKKDYRKYHIKTVKGANDYESMKEVIYRRYLRLQMENSPLPDLIVMDGGEIQVNAALEILQVLNVNVPVMGIMKDEHHKAKSIIYNNKEILLDKNTDLYLLLVNISQTVHDFAISFLGVKKQKASFHLDLMELKVLALKRKKQFLKDLLM